MISGKAGSGGGLLNLEGLLLWGNSVEEGGKKEPSSDDGKLSPKRGLWGSAGIISLLSLTPEFIFSLSLLTRSRETDSHSRREPAPPPNAEFLKP